MARRSPGDEGVSVIEFRLTADVLGNTRFAFSPLAEVGASLRLLAQPRPAHPHRPWLRQVRPCWTTWTSSCSSHWYRRAMGTGIPVPACDWAGDKPAGPAGGPGRGCHRGAEEDLAKVWEGRPLPRQVVSLLAAGGGLPRCSPKRSRRTGRWRSRRGGRRCAACWRTTCPSGRNVASRWAVRTVVRLSSRGHVGQDSRAIRIDKPHFADATYRGAALTLVPSVFVWPRLVVSHSEPAPSNSPTPPAGWVGSGRG